MNLRSGLKATTTICTAILSAALVPALVAGLAPATAEAQDYTSGAVVVSVKSPAGAPVAGATVTLVSQAQGISKTLTTSANGAATATGLTPGEYDVTVTANGYDTFKTTATVVVSQSVTYTYALTTVGGSGSTEVVVKGKRVRQDFNKTTAGLSVDLTTLTSQQPIGRSIEAVTLLAPTAVNSSAFGEPSIGGGSAAENAFYVNGLNITNPDTFVGGALVPFDFYKTVDVQTSGYPAEFGRATGGVVNNTTKSGTNNFMFAVHGNFAPQSLKSTPFASSVTTSPLKYRYNAANTLSFESGGALIKDKLFLYGLVQLQDTKAEFASTSGGYFEKDKNTDPFYGLKADWYITPGQHVELTYFDTTQTTDQTRYTYLCPTSTTGTGANKTCAAGPTGQGTGTGVGKEVIGTKGYGAKTRNGGPSWVAKYTGTITDWFTISAAYGDSKNYGDFTSNNPNDNYAVSWDGARFARTSVNQIYSAATTVDDWERKFYRADADFRFEALGRHHVRMGFDHEDVSMTKTTKLPGAQPIRYYMVPSSSYGYILYENLGGHVSGKASSYYIQDSWDITPTLNLQVGLRNDDFEESNLSNQKFLNLTGNMAPRLGLSWKPSADSAWRFTASYGQYYIPPAMNLGFRGKDLYFIEGFDAPSGGYVLDANGLPTNVGTPNGAYEGSATCPASDASSAPGHITGAGGPYCAVFGSGVQEPAAQKAAVGLKATRETEYTLGTTWRANDLWQFGLTYVHRTLDRVSEDTDFAPYINDYCTAKGYTGCDYQNEYHVWNIGSTVTINTFSTLPGGEKQLTLTNLAFPKPDRKYDALTFDFKRAFDGKWGLQGSYTYSKLKGNYQGTVLDLGSGTGQTDAGSTQLYDYPGLAENGEGTLSNNRDHQFKVWGSFAVTPDFLVGANVSVLSPNYLSCYARYPHRDTFNGEAAFEYGASSHFCVDTSTLLGTHNGTKYYNYVNAPTGTGAKTDWTQQVDVSMRYTVPAAFALGGKLVLRADIFNLFDRKEITSRNMASDTGSFCGPTTSDPTAPGTLHQCVAKANSLYGTANGYNTSRYMRVGFDLTY